VVVVVVVVVVMMEVVMVSIMVTDTMLAFTSNNMRLWPRGNDDKGMTIRE